MNKIETIIADWARLIFTVKYIKKRYSTEYLFYYCVGFLTHARNDERVENTQPTFVSAQVMTRGESLVRHLFIRRGRRRWRSRTSRTSYAFKLVGRFALKPPSLVNVPFSLKNIRADIFRPFLMNSTIFLISYFLFLHSPIGRTQFAPTFLYICLLSPLWALIRPFLIKSS